MLISTYNISYFIHLVSLAAILISENIRFASNCILDANVPNGFLERYLASSFLYEVSAIY